MLMGPLHCITRGPRAGPPPSLPSRAQPNPVRLGNIPHGIFPGRKTPLAILCKNQKDRKHTKKRAHTLAWPGRTPPLSPQAVGSVAGAGQPLPD